MFKLSLLIFDNCVSVRLKQLTKAELLSDIFKSFLIIIIDIKINFLWLLQP